jgi:uncharacterized heparinase superfamily protein
MSDGGTSAAALYWHTIRHLRPIQIGARIAKVFPAAAPRDAAPPSRRERTGRWIAAARRRPSMRAPMTYDFLNESLVIGDSWDAPGATNLWKYNLHYFDDLNALSADAREAWHIDAISRWITSNPPGTGHGWDPYPASLRIVNWIKFALARGMDGSFDRSLAIQARHLDRHVEYHLLGNHLLANAKALSFAGIFFEGPEARAWLAKGLRILAREIPEQVLSDGGHFERSPMYQSIVLEDLLDLLNLFRAYGLDPGSMADVAGRMLGWLHTMCHEDGEISFFNDAATGIAPTPAELTRYARELGLAAKDASSRVECGEVVVSHLAATGYLRAQTPSASAFVDVAPIGPDYLPGHSHADTLSFEASVRGNRVIVNGGTSRYGKGAEREAERATFAHSTVTIDSRDSSEVWGGFRVARRAYPRDLRVDCHGPELVLSCAHDGYRRLPGSPIHRRTWRMGADRLAVLDRIEGPYREAVARFILHPDVTCHLENGGLNAMLSTGDETPIRIRIQGARGRVGNAYYCPEFGKRLPTVALEVPLTPGIESTFEMSW